jgi:1-acyl-sn-glycerol-3-phosphate acyltransferase
MIYRLVRIFINIVVKLTMKLEVEGLENLPQSGSFIATSNHLGRLDAVLIWYFLKRKDIIVIVAEKYQENRFFRWFARQLNAIFVDRYNADVSTMRQVLARLKKGEVFVVAPEGTRSRTGALIQARQGAAYIAAKAGLPILPVAVTGTEDRLAKQQFIRLRRLRVHGRVGKLYTLPPLPRQDRDQALQTYTDEMMCQIAALLPPEYRGVYAEHPRLKELLDLGL